MSKGKAAEYIRKIANIDDVRVIPCKVDAVNGRTCDVTPISGDAPIKNVRLNTTVTGSQGILITPVVGKPVLIIMINRADAFVAMFSEIESIIIDGGQNKGLVKIDPLVSWMQKVHTDLTTLQSLLLTHPVAGNGAALGLSFNPTTEAPVSTTLQNAKIKH